MDNCFNCATLPCSASASALFCCSNSDWLVSEWRRWERVEVEAAAGGRDDRDVGEARMWVVEEDEDGEVEVEKSDERTLQCT